MKGLELGNHRVQMWEQTRTKESLTGGKKKTQHKEGDRNELVFSVNPELGYTWTEGSSGGQSVKHGKGKSRK